MWCGRKTHATAAPATVGGEVRGQATGGTPLGRGRAPVSREPGNLPRLRSIPLERSFPYQRIAVGDAVEPLAMHIELGIIDNARLVAANTAALGVVATQARAVVRAPLLLVKAGLAAVIFSALMQSWNLSVGPSELHLIGATTVYLLFGFVPTLLGFALGLVLQALLFEPQDMLHIGVNTLSLTLPMIGAHFLFGRRLFATDGQERFTLARVLRLDAVYYAGVAAMVAFWLGISNDPAPVADWARWAVAYLPVFLAEACLTFATVSLLGHWRDRPVLATLSDLGRLRFA
jgi:cobalt/nickel transport system permease protein